MEFLEHRGSYDGGEKVAPRPGLILLDLNLPRLDGREVLRRIKNDPQLSTIPVVVLTTSNDEEDVLSCYDAGANTYVTKPIAFDGFLKTVRTIDRYWFSTAEIPHARKN
jgi:CheY-like chemotaxis protein